MKIKITLLIYSFAVVFPLRAKAETKLPDSYAFTRGEEAYSEDKNQYALDWFNTEVSEHPHSLTQKSMSAYIASK